VKGNPALKGDSWQRKAHPPAEAVPADAVPRIKLWPHICRLRPSAGAHVPQNGRTTTISARLIIGPARSENEIRAFLAERPFLYASSHDLNSF